MSENNYFRIKVSSIRPGVPTNFDLYVQIGGRKVLYLRTGDKLSSDKIATLDQKGADSFFVTESHRQSYKNYVHEEMTNEALPVEAKAQLLRDSSIAMMEELFETPDVSKALDESKSIINEFVDFMQNEPEGMAHLIGLSGHDFYTYQHSLDVAIYCLGIGQASQFSDADLIELGRGALFHDIGKRNVAVEIICKDGPLDDEEWAQMQKHPLFGLKILNDQPDISDHIKACCFEHHENFLGNGYPQQLKGEEIHPMARIVAIADTFDAMTTQRSYNTPLSPKDALLLMKEKLASRFDINFLDAMYGALFRMEETFKNY